MILTINCALKLDIDTRKHSDETPRQFVECNDWMSNGQCRAVFPTMRLMKSPDEASSTIYKRNQLETVNSLDCN